MAKYSFIVLIIILFSSCQTSRHYLVKNQEWALATEGNYQIIKDTVTDEKFFYNVILLDNHFYGDLSSELFSLPVLNGFDKENKNLHIDDLTKSVLKSVEFEIQTDTLYFIVRGNIIAFSSPDFDINKATSIISLDSKSEWNIEDPPMRTIYHESLFEFNGNDIFRTLYYYPKKKQYLIRDCFRTKDAYLNLVYIFQSRTKKYEKTKPREWCTMWDVTSPQNIFHTVKLFKTANALSVKNKLENLIE